ncbi:MAG: hypothetical protein MI919_33535 [Holophagales bacterium]|nr:hypothetical protein [Holophagales bacterium]
MSGRRPTEAECRRALDQHQERLVALEDVVGLGIGEDEGTGALAVMVYVSEKKPRDQLEHDQVIPAVLPVSGGEAGETVEIPTRVVEVGHIRPDIQGLP